MQMKAQIRFIVGLLAVVVGFGSQWNCTITIGDAGNKGGGPPPAPPASYGCMNQHPTYTLGEPPAQDEFTIIIREFKPAEAARAYDLSTELRSRRVYNSIWTQFDGSVVVSVGRYWTEKQAEDKLRALIDRGYHMAHIAKPRTPPVGPVRPVGPQIDIAAVVAMLFIVVLVVLAVSQAKNKS